MEIGNQIRVLRQERGMTQEEMARHLGVTAQDVSRWECGTAAPDIALLPEISAYFGVTIDALFSLSDDTRMERIENMLDQERYLKTEDVEAEERFLLEKARREPQNGRPYELLAAIEEHIAHEHQERAAEYAREALGREPDLQDAHSMLVQAMNGKCWDWCETNHHELIRFYKQFVAEHPDNWNAIMWLLDQLVDDGRFKEAEEYLKQLAAVRDDWRPGLYRGILMWSRGEKAAAYAHWSKLAEEYEQQWSLWDSIADFLARDGSYEQSVMFHRKALEVSKAPRYTDAIISIAQIREIQGNIDGALQARQEQIELLQNDWQITEGESIDEVKREIERLQQMKKER